MNRNKVIKYLLVAALVVGVAIAFIYRDEFNPEKAKSWIDSAGPAAPLLFAALYISATVLFLPGSVFTLLGGALFGPWWGFLINLTAATCGAGIAFIISRYLASDWVGKKAGGIAKKLIDGVDSEGWRFVAFVRLVPIFPFNLLNYALGLTKIPFGHYIVTTFIAMGPGAFAFTYIGHAGKEAVTGQEGAIQTGLIGLALVATALFLPRLIKKMRGEGGAKEPEAAKNVQDREPPK